MAPGDSTDSALTGLIDFTASGDYQSLILTVSGDYQSQNMVGSFPLAHHLEGDSDHGTRDPNLSRRRYQGNLWKSGEILLDMIFLEGGTRKIGENVQFDRDF